MKCRFSHETGAQVGAVVDGLRAVQIPARALVRDLSSEPA